ncbi:hypothetical protein NLG97_g10193 [Lecanicillium saksenae]|uniref:Uncharacterized protein n=1 Tax=Lecanicillium saksenae TaxID=468837 RepID=A0ACC1QGM4_9HYPO|nr:hypothetical protein NLG97_g10193 [Lecanicillium saksenae]
MTTPVMTYRAVRAVGFRHGGAALSRWNSSVVDVSPLKFDPPAPPATQQHDKLQEEAKRKIFQDAVAADHVRHNWTRPEIAAIYYQPLLELAHQANIVHRKFHKAGEVQLCTLMNIKTGGCTEDCSYCAQSTRYQKGTGLEAKRVESVESVLAAARTARENGSTRFCMGAAWRDMRGRKNSLKNITAMVKGVKAMGMEVCVTLGMIDGEQAKQLKEAGLTAYNHNVDTSREFYPSVISTRSYDERLQTLSHVREAGINVCSGGILGLGESSEDRIGLLETVSTLPSHPESFPVNALVPIKGTPLGDREPIAFTSMLRTIATARIIMPATISARRRPQDHVGGEAGPLLHGRRQRHLHRREDADDRLQRLGRGQRHVWPLGTGAHEELRQVSRRGRYSSRRRQATR